MSRRLLLWTSVLIGLQVVSGGAVLGDVIGPKLAGMAVLVVAGLQAGTANYTSRSTVSRSEAVPKGEVMARQTDPGAPVLATPAAQAAYGIPAGAVVDVNPTAGPPT